MIWKYAAETAAVGRDVWGKDQVNMLEMICLSANLKEMKHHWKTTKLWYERVVLRVFASKVDSKAYYKDKGQAYVDVKEVSCTWL